MKGADSGGECGFAYMARFPFASSPLITNELALVLHPTADTSTSDGIFDDKIVDNSDDLTDDMSNDNDDCMVASGAQVCSKSYKRPCFSFSIACKCHISTCNILAGLFSHTP